MIKTTQVSSRSHQLYEKAIKLMPGGVNSPVRALQSVGTEPIFIDHADGVHLYDVDGNRYIDYVGSWGPMILGHRHPRVLEAIEDVLRLGTSFGAPCKAEVELAEIICHSVPSIEMVRMVNSGTEATMSAIRLARAFTGRTKILKFNGCYHGHADSFLVKAGSGLATLGTASSPGVPENLIALTISIPFNDKEVLKKAFAESGESVAAVIVEPIMGNAGLILPEDGYLEFLRNLCTEHGTILIFDEVMTGFRVALGGAQEYYGIKPDLTCLGKIIGGGLPVGAYGGRKDIMEMVAPQGPVYQAGTLSGNPLAMAAGIAQLTALQTHGTYSHLAQTTNDFAQGLRQILVKSQISGQVVSVPGMICLFFTSEKVNDFAAAKTSNTDLFAKVWRFLLQRGIYWPPSQFESAFISIVHSKNVIEETLHAFEEAISESMTLKA
jgi:glutamate-1-semialdehyde 2,1-aminomutase